MTNLLTSRGTLLLLLACPTFAQVGEDAQVGEEDLDTYSQDEYSQDDGYGAFDEGYQDLYGDNDALPQDQATGGAYKNWDWERSDAFAPMALRNTFLLAPGQWALGYRFDHQSFDGLRDGRDDESTSEVFATPGTDYAFVPTEMTWVTHTFSAYYGVQDGWTLFADVPVISKDMDVTLDDGVRDSFDETGLGDIQIGGIHDLGWSEEAITLAHFGLGLPTGGYDERDGGEPLPFPMQAGIGTFALHPGFTYMRQEDDWSYGMWGEGRIHLGRNDDNYSAGDIFQVSAWAAYPFSRNFSGSLRIAGNWSSDYHGESETIDENRSPVNTDEIQGRDRVDLFFGGQWDFSNERRLHRLGVELGFPVDEWLDGPQLSTEWMAVIGYQIAL